MYKYFLCLRYLRKRRIAFFAVAAVCLCVAMVVIVVSVMDGFLKMVVDRSRGMLGDLVMENASLQGFPYYQEFIDELKHDLPNAIEEATPVIISYGVLRFPTDQITKPVQIVGIRMDETCRVNDFAKGLFYDKYYPGTTALGPQKEPRTAPDENGVFRLPPELETARQQWESKATPDEIADAPRLSASRYKGPGIYLPVTEEMWLKQQGPAWAGDELPGVIIGRDLCAERLPTGGYERYYNRGYTVQLTFVPFTDTGKPLGAASGMPSRLFRYTDDQSTGIYDIDSMSVYVDFDLLQDVLAMKQQQLSEDSGGGTIPARATQVQIKLKASVANAADVLAIRDEIKTRWDHLIQRHLDEVRTPALLQRVRILTWKEKQQRFIEAVEKEKVLVTTLFGVISVVAVLLVGCIFYMIVQQKTRDIGIIKSVGATAMGVAGIFLAYGAAVGIVGGAIGSVVGCLFVTYINEIQELLVWLNPAWRVWDAAVYSFSVIPNEVSGQNVAMIYGIAIVASMIGSLLAAVRAARIWPVEALRYE